MTPMPSPLGLTFTLVTSLLATAPGRCTEAGGQLLFVGPSRSLTRPSEAAAVARDGVVVEIDAAVYLGDVAVWRQNGLTLRGSRNGRAHLMAAGRAAEGKAIWVVMGDNATVENVELSGARVSGHNGAGIRAEGVGLTIRNCRFHHNEMGLLTNNDPAGWVTIERSEFDHNTTDTEGHGRLGHNIYIGRISRFVLRASYVHDAHIGHLVKSRATHNQILGNRILDADGDSSYLIDLPEGGRAEIRNNVLRQGARSANRAAIDFAAEANRDAPGQSLKVIGNDFVSEGAPATFVRNFSIAPALLQGNRVRGEVRPVVGKGEVR